MKLLTVEDMKPIHSNGRKTAISNGELNSAEGN